MDVVYIVGPGDDNQELRYSLRSLANLTHDRVWIAGHRPPWVSGVGHILTVQPRDKHINSTINVRAACEHADVSDPFILFNDDFYVTQQVGQVPTWHRGQLTVFARQTELAGQYRYGAGATLQLLQQHGYADPLSYELHVPLIVHKVPMLRALDLGRHVRTLHKRTLYGNLAGLGGTGHVDVKVDDDSPPDPSWPFWSTDETSWRYCRIGDLIRDRFRDPSPHEAISPDQKETTMPYYINTRTGALTKVADPADIPGRKAAMHARRTIERMDRSRRWRRATEQEVAADRSVKPAPAPEPQPAAPSSERQDGVHAVGGGWHEVVVDGEVVDKVRGAEVAQQVYDEHA